MKADTNNLVNHIENLQIRSPLIAAQWLTTIENCGALTVPSIDAKKITLDLLNEIIINLFGENMLVSRIIKVGEQLAELNYKQPEVISQTVSLLTHELLNGLKPNEVVVILPRLSQILGTITLGYIEEYRRQTLKEGHPNRLTDSSHKPKLTFRW